MLRLNKPVVRVRYDLHEVAGPRLESLLAPVIERARKHAPVGVA